jgi:hypothetical protein
MINAPEINNVVWLRTEFQKRQVQRDLTFQERRHNLATELHSPVYDPYWRMRGPQNAPSATLSPTLQILLGMSAVLFISFFCVAFTIFMGALSQ